MYVQYALCISLTVISIYDYCYGIFLSIVRRGVILLTCDELNSFPENKFQKLQILELSIRRFCHGELRRISGEQ